MMPKRKSQTLKMTLRELLPAAKALLELERDARGVARQWTHVPREVIEIPLPLVEAQNKINRRYLEIVGTGPQGVPPHATPEIIRDLLQAIQAVADLVAAGFDLGGLPGKVREVWSDDPNLYDLLEAGKFHGGWIWPKGAKITLRDDGSLVQDRGDRAGSDPRDN